MVAPTELLFDLVKPDEIPDAVSIELEGFPPDEAADLEKFKFRQENAPDLFLGAFIPQSDKKREIIGYVCSTLSPSDTITHESMSMHVPGSPTVCVHSICIKNSSRRKGIATQLLKEYISRLRARAEAGSVPYERIALISHEELIPFYENAGFTNLGKSEVVHGSLSWYELRVELKSTAHSTGYMDGKSASITSLTASHPSVVGDSLGESQTDRQIPPGLWEALSRGSSSRNKPPAQLFSSFDNPDTSVTTEDTRGKGILVNKFDLICPRIGCGSVILKKGVGEWVERASEQLQPIEVPLNPLLAPLPPPGQTAQWWLITPSHMAFENIGVSKVVESLEKRKQLLACAECDLGPLGWSEERGKESWLACSRVAYRT